MPITAAQAQAAYLKILDANDNSERAHLLKYILADSKTSLLFLLNCSYNKYEAQLAFENIVDNPKYCHELLKKDISKLTSEQRIAALSTVICDADLAWDVAWESNLTRDEKKQIYKMHYAHYLEDKSLSNYWTQWNTFGDIFPDEEMQIFVNMIYKCNSYESSEMAQTLLKYGKLTAEQREKLDSKLLVKVLRE